MSTAAVHAIEPWQASPIDRSSLATLKDLGLSDAQVASYYRVPQHQVATLRVSYGIADNAMVTSTPPRRRRVSWRRRA